MNEGLIKLYRRVSDGYLRLDEKDRAVLRKLNQRETIDVDHVFMVPEDKSINWNCFGGGVEELSRTPTEERFKPEELISGVGNIAWMRAVYGSEHEGKSDQKTVEGREAAGVTNLFNGVCQTVGNRLMAMTKENVDSSKAKGNELVVLIFGKYGYGVEDFVKLIRTKADELNAVKPGTVSAEEVERTVANLEEGLKPKAEIDALIDDLPVPEEVLVSLLGEKVSLFLQGYGEFQQRREEKYQEIVKNRCPGYDVRGEMKAFIIGELKRQETQLRDFLKTEEKVRAILPYPPEAIFAAFENMK